MHEAFARKLDVEQWLHSAGIVRSRDADGLRVAAHGVVFEALRALSCLVEPEVGDQVLFTRARTGGVVYVLAVLERQGGAPIALVSPRDTELRAGGRFSLVAGDATIAARSFALHTRNATVHASRVTAVLGSVDALLDRVVQHAKRAFRFIEELDHLRAGTVDYEAKSTMSLHAENTTMTAEGLVKVDGEQIQLG